MTTQDYLLIVEAASVTVGLISLIALHIDRRSRRQPPPKPPVKPKRLSLAEQAEAESWEQRNKAHFDEMRRVEDRRRWDNHVKQDPDWIY